MDENVLILAVTAVLTMISPAVIQWQKSSSWSKTLRVALPIGVSLILAFGYLLYEGSLEGLNIFAAFLLVYGLQQLVYSTIVKWATGLGKNDPDEDYEPRHLAE